MRQVTNGKTTWAEQPQNDLKTKYVSRHNNKGKTTSHKAHLEHLHPHKGRNPTTLPRA